MLNRSVNFHLDERFTKRAIILVDFFERSVATERREVTRDANKSRENFETR